MKREQLIVTFIAFVNAMSVSVVIPVIYSYAIQYGLNDFEASLLLTLFALSQFVATPIIGRLSDYYGRKPLLAVSLAGTAASNLMAAFAPSAVFLFIARILDGITGGNNSVAQAVISDITEEKDRAKAFGMFGAAFGVAFILGPILSIVLVNISLAAPYLASAVLAAVATLITVFLLPETLQKKETKRLTLGGLGFADVIKGLFIPVIGSILITLFMSTLFFNVFVFAFQPYIINVLGESETQVAMILVIAGLSNVVAQIGVLPRVTGKFKNTSILITSFIITSVSLILFILPQAYWPVLIITPLFSGSVALSRPIITALISLNTKPEDQGVALGIGESYFSLAGAIGPAFGGLLVTSFSTQTPFIVSAILGIITAFYVWMLRNRIEAGNKIDL